MATAATPELAALADDHVGETRRRHHSGHGRLHEPRAGARQVGRQALRYLGVRLRALRDAHRPQGIRSARPSLTRSPRSSSASQTGDCSRRRRRQPSAVCCSDVSKRTSSRRLRDIGDACLELDDAIGRFGSRSLPRRLFDFGREQLAGCGRRVIAASIALIAGWSWRDLGAASRRLRRSCTRPSRRSPLNQGSSGFPVCRRTANGSCMVADTDGNRDIFLQSTTGQTPINLTPDSARRRRSAGVLARRRAYRFSIQPRRRWNLRHGPHRERRSGG